ncbi:MAG: hypothetical protein V9E96_01795 [Chitinophagaceae bacterium]|jgi:hypothetical protein
MKQKISVLAILVVVLIIFLPSLIHAQPVFDDDVNDVPVDGGLSLLIAAGVGYGVRKMGENRKR